MTRPSLKRKLVITGVLLFFLGLPLVGTVGAYLHAHSTMRSSAIAFVEKEVPPILRERDFSGLYFYGTLTLKGTLKKEQFDSWMDKSGAFRSLRDLRATRSTVGVRQDQAWQFVDMECVAEFSKGSARLHIRAARRSTALPEWRIEEFDLGPVE